MANSFNRYHWNPIRHGYYPQPQGHIQSINPKVINIPVQFIGTDERTTKMSPATPALVPSEEARMSAAVTIQRAVRGFVVRKNARVVRQVAAEVDKMERMLKEEEAKIRMDARERLRVNEALMALLLRLDTVRGVREFRKKVIRRVITLQETIDSISAAADGTTPAIGIAEDREYSSSEADEESLIDNEKEADQTLDQDEETNGADVELEMEIPPSVGSPNAKNDIIAAGDDGNISTSAIADNRKDLMFEAAEETNEAAAEMEMKIQELDESANRQNNLIGLGIGSGVDSLDTEEIPKGDDLVSSQCSSLMVDSPTEADEESLIDNEKEADQTLDQDEETNGADVELEMEIPQSVGSPNAKNDIIAAGDDGNISMSAIADNRKDLMFEATEETNEAAAEMEMKIQELDESANRQNNLIGLGIGSGVDSLDTEEIPKGNDLVSSQCSSLMVDSPAEEKGQEGIEMREIMQNMAAENERLKQMVEQLCATSAEQCSLMEGLAGRIERLERFVVNRMDRRRKKRGPVSSAK